MESGGQLPLDQATSTPEKNDFNKSANMTGLSEVSAKHLTPIDDLQSITYHDKDYINTVMSKADRGDTFFPESIDRIAKLRNEADADITPLFNKLPKKGLDLNVSSTPLNKEDTISKPLQFNFNKPTRNIFNLSPELPSTQPVLTTKGSFGSTNAVKDAFNTFDKSSNKFPSANSSVRLLKARKRLRTSDSSINNYSDIVDNSSRSNFRISANTSFTKLKSENTKKHSKVETIRQIISDPQCISNLTLIIQVALNAIMMLIFLSIAMVGFFAIKRDVDRKIVSYVNEAIFKINSCKRDYFINNCAPEMRAPALENKCNEWGTCMEQDPEAVITSMAYFEVLADCINAFFHHISLKSLLGLGCLLLFCIIVPNILFVKFRSSTTINQNYYSQSQTDNESHSISKSLSPVKPFDSNGSFQLLSGQKSLTGSIRHEVNSATSVRFNPNVSYSFYEYNNENSPNFDNQLAPRGSSSEEEDIDTEIGNQRILGEI